MRTPSFRNETKQANIGSGSGAQARMGSPYRSAEPHVPTQVVVRYGRPRCLPIGICGVRPHICGVRPQLIESIFAVHLRHPAV